MSTESHYFIAIPLPESVQRFFSTWQDELEGELPYKQWTQQADLHITLKFLGAVDDNKRKQIGQALQSMREFEAFTLHVGTIGTFGKPSMPRVLWAGVEKTPLLTTLQEQVKIRLENIGYSAEKRAYVPHITLAKKWQGKAAEDLLENIIKHYTAQKEILVDTIVLYQIHPTSVPKYEPVCTYRLQGGE